MRGGRADRLRCLRPLLDASGILARTAERRAVQQANYRATTGDLQELASLTVYARQPHRGALRPSRHTHSEYAPWSSHAQSLVLYVDQRAFVAADGAASHDLDRAIGPHDLPIGAARHDLPLSRGPSTSLPRMSMIRRRPRAVWPRSWICPNLALMTKVKRNRARRRCSRRCHPDSCAGPSANRVDEVATRAATAAAGRCHQCSLVDEQDEVAERLVPVKRGLADDPRAVAIGRIADVEPDRTV
jgi:hypothetical protein